MITGRGGANLTVMIYYAVGDVHGCADQLDQLLDRIDHDAARRAGGQVWRIVMLGDYVDRGPDSAGVLDRVIALDKAGHIVLPGNHEHLMHAALSADKDTRESTAQAWWSNGGKQTLQSYRPAAKLSARKPWRAYDAVPGHHRDFLDALLNARPVYHRDDADGLFFVHAGVQPGVKLARTRTEALLWTRDKTFMAADGPVWKEGLRVVHGHTPGDAVQRFDHRVGLDTGAVYGGALSCGVFQDGALVHSMGVAGPA